MINTSMLDVDQETTPSSDLEVTNRRSCRANRSTEVISTDNLLIHPKQPKRKSSSLEADDQAVSQSQDASESFIDLTFISNKVLEPDEVHHVLVQQSDEKYHRQVPFLTQLFVAVASPQAFRQLTEACIVVRQNYKSIKQLVSTAALACFSVSRQYFR